jgi:hypothetical protein
MMRQWRHPTAKYNCQLFISYVPLSNSTTDADWAALYSNGVNSLKTEFLLQGPAGKPDVFNLALVPAMVVWEELTDLQQLKVCHFSRHGTVDRGNRAFVVERFFLKLVTLLSWLRDVSVCALMWVLAVKFPAGTRFCCGSQTSDRLAQYQRRNRLEVHELS